VSVKFSLLDRNGRERWCWRVFVAVNLLAFPAPIQ